MAGSKKRAGAKRPGKSAEKAPKVAARGVAERCDAAIRAAHEDVTAESLASLRALLERAAKERVERPLFVIPEPNANGEAEPES